MSAFREAQKHVNDATHNEEEQYADLFEKDSDEERMEEPKVSSERIVKYQGKWYTESKIIELERKTKKVWKCSNLVFDLKRMTGEESSGRSGEERWCARFCEGIIYGLDANARVQQYTGESFLHSQGT